MSEKHNAATESSGGETALAVGLAGLAGVLRLVAPYNMTPMNALGLFGGARLPLRLACTLPLAVMVLSDLAIWWMKDWMPFNPFVYGSFLLSVLLGRLLANSNSVGKIAAGTIACTLQFFLITNFGVWLGASDKPEKIPPSAAYMYDTDTPYKYPLIRYARTPAGLVACYAHGFSFSDETRAKAPPFGFFGNLLAGDLIFTALLFGAHAFLARRLGKPALAAAPAVDATPLTGATNP